MAVLSLALTLALSTAHADVVTLDSGAQVEGHIAHYEHAGDCGIEVDGGELAGALLVVPCDRVVRFERSPEAVAVVPLSSPLSAGPPEVVAPMAAPVVPVETAPVALASAATEPVAEDAVVAEPEPVVEDAVVEEPVAEDVEVAEPEAEPAVSDESTEAPAETGDTEEEAAPTGWRAALPEGVQLPEFVRKRRAPAGS